MNLNNLFKLFDINNDGRLTRKAIYKTAKQLNWYWNEAPIYAVLDYLTIKKSITKGQFISYMKMIINDPYGDILLNQNFSYVESSKAVLIIDPQNSFTSGLWRESLPDEDIKPIQTAFHNCAKFLTKHYKDLNIMFSRCPFPGDSYEWDNSIKELLDDDQLYFIKPGNSILFPSTNGFSDWIIKSKIKTLIIGGCTLNSCIRVSAVEIKKTFPDLNIEVDLSISGVRESNYKKSSLFNGLSPVEAAINEMKDIGVKISPRNHCQ